MIEIRESEQRGHARYGWLDSRHSFSFAHYYDPEHMGFGHLRVLNEDRVAPGRGFEAHSHRDMEILSIVLDGALEHRDSMGNGSVVRPGEVQVMSAGRGITHSEFNPSLEDPLHFLQIWLLPERRGLDPSYAQRAFPTEARSDRWCLVASRDGRDDSLRVHQDVDVWIARIGDGSRIVHPLEPGRRAWVQAMGGRAMLNGVAIGAGDGAAVESESAAEVVGSDDATDILMFDLA